MKMLIFFFVLFIQAQGVTAWGKPNAPYEFFHQPTIVLKACEGAVSGSATYCSKEKSYTCYCYNPAYLQSIVGCLSQSDKFKRVYVDFMVEFCAKMGKNYTLDQIYGAYLNWTQNALTTLQIPDFNMSQLIETPLLLDKGVVLLFQDSFDKTFSNYNHSLYYGLIIVAFWHIVLVAAGACNWAKVLLPGFVKRCTGPVLTFWRRYISTPALLRRRRNAERKVLNVFDFLVPTRLELIILLSFLLIVIIVCLVDLSVMDSDPVYKSRYIAKVHYMADRTGIVVLIYMPLLVLFAGRNNIMQWLTRWSFATFICFHRWLARVAFSLVLVHAICFSISLQEKYTETSTQTFFINGVIAASAGGIIMVQGLLTIRRRWYEVFLFTHIFMAAAFVGAAWSHVTTFGYVWFYYAALAVWVLDRLIRAIRLLIFGFPTASVTLIADETLRVVVPKAKFWKALPGGHAFITFWRASCFWQSHPFTFTLESNDPTKVVLYCKVKTGITHSLYSYLITHPGRKAHIRVSLEGPYGEPLAAYRYDTAVFAAGGNGIPGIYSEAMHCAKMRRRQRIRLLWIIREYKLLFWFYKELMALKDTYIQMTVFVTKPDMNANLIDFETRLASLNDESINPSDDHYGLKVNGSGSFDAFSGGLESFDLAGDKQGRHAHAISTIHAELSHIEFREGRPDIDEIISYEKDSTAGSICFVACGHPVMVDDIRYAVVHNMENGGKRIDFFEQLQTWA